MHTLQPLVVVAGPTASGKTALAVELARRLDGEVVSADSMQVYLPLRIGTARPTAEEMEGIPHHPVSYTHLDVYKRQNPISPAWWPRDIRSRSASKWRIPPPPRRCV